MSDQAMLDGKRYPEIHSRRGDRDYLPDFPEHCPICGANRYAIAPGVTVAYNCGGGYVPKPQIQSHTLKWWGHCGVGPIR